MIDRGLVLAIDQGTTGTTGLLVDDEGRPVAASRREVRQIYPRPGWVEHDPEELLRSCLDAAREVLERAGAVSDRIRGVGISNQRETTLVWDRHTGAPVSNAIVWQCRRTAPLCQEIAGRGLGDAIRKKTGLILDAYFSATKLRWILDNVVDGQARAQAGELLFGTVDSWLLWNLTGGAVHATDVTNASRTMLYNIHTLEWDSDLMRELDIPEAMLPGVLPSSHPYGESSPGTLADAPLPLAALAGDQQAALFGQACYDAGMTKNTYGTGSFVLMHSGERPVLAPGLVTAMACGTSDLPAYALEGSIFVTGAAVQWLRDGLGIIGEAAESEELARTVADSGGVYFVPAFVGLGAPYWDSYARGTMLGISRGTTRGHLARATLEAIAYQSRDVIDVMVAEGGLDVPVLRVDGGASANAFLMQFQADILGVPIQPAAVLETTALGAAYLAGLTAGVWRDTGEVASMWRPATIYEPGMSVDQRESLYRGWRRAVERSLGWATHQAGGEA